VLETMPAADARRPAVAARDPGARAGRRGRGGAEGIRLLQDPRVPHPRGDHARGRRARVHARRAAGGLDPLRRRLPRQQPLRRPAEEGAVRPLGHRPARGARAGVQRQGRVPLRRAARGNHEAEGHRRRRRGRRVRDVLRRVGHQRRLPRVPDRLAIRQGRQPVRRAVPDRVVHERRPLPRLVFEDHAGRQGPPVRQRHPLAGGHRLQPRGGAVLLRQPGPVERHELAEAPHARLVPGPPDRQPLVRDHQRRDGPPAGRTQERQPVSRRGAAGEGVRAAADLAAALEGRPVGQRHLVRHVGREVRAVRQPPVRRRPAPLEHHAVRPGEGERPPPRRGHPVRVGVCQRHRADDPEPQGRLPLRRRHEPRLGVRRPQALRAGARRLDRQGAVRRVRHEGRPGRLHPHLHRARRQGHRGRREELRDEHVHLHLPGRLRQPGGRPDHADHQERDRRRRRQEREARRRRHANRQRPRAAPGRRAVAEGHRAAAPRCVLHVVGTAEV
ncbi:MAG: probable large, multifunctional secreted protein, partial [uncultured Phycisphaerae bacterium]